MAEKAEVKSEALPDLDDLLQCPVCYEIPAGQIFQCNEGHHVCGRCKIRLDLCPVCRALFFGTRNYAMEELIANVRKLRAFKLGGKVTTGSISSEGNTAPREETAAETDTAINEDEENNLNFASRPSFRAPQACKGLFRCLCCKSGNSQRLPAARLLNHLRYFHSPELIEGHSENGEYVQAWQFSTVPGRLVTAVRVADMGIFFLVIEISDDSVCAWLTMASSPWVAHEFSYTVTISGNDREAIFSDCVWSVRSCEGSLKKRGHCLVANGSDARALVAPVSISGKLTVRRVPADQLAHQAQPRATMRVASRGHAQDSVRSPASQVLEPFLQDLQNDVARLSRAFATLGREATALVRSETEMRARIENGPRSNQNAASGDQPAASPQVAPPPSAPAVPSNDNIPLSRNARRRMRQRLRAALNATQPATASPPGAAAPVQDAVPAPSQRVAAPAPVQRAAVPVQRAAAPTAAARGPVAAPPIERHFSGLAVVQEAPAPSPQLASGPSNGLPHTGNQTRANKKKRRQRR